MISNRFYRLNAFKFVLSNDVSPQNFSIKPYYANFRKFASVSFTDVITRENSKVYFTKEAQLLMKKLTGFDVEKVFRARAISGRIRCSRHKFMTTEQLKRAQEYAIRKGYEKLQKPPLVPAFKGEVEILEERPEIIGFSKSNYVFTDISYGISDAKRLIVVREPTGTLRKAVPTERHRMNELYFPREGREYQHPRMFEPEHLQPLLDKGEYLFILDRACIQFEPNDPQFHEVTFKTYKKINEDKAFNLLRSTRHYGPFVYYLCIEKNLDSLLQENLNTERLDEAVWLIELYCLIHPDCKFKTTNGDPENKIEYIRAFVENECSKRELLSELLDTYCDKQSRPADTSSRVAGLGKYYVDDFWQTTIFDFERNDRISIFYHNDDISSKVVSISLKLNVVQFMMIDKTVTRYYEYIA